MLIVSRRLCLCRIDLLFGSIRPTPVMYSNVPPRPNESMSRPSSIYRDLVFRSTWPPTTRDLGDFIGFATRGRRQQRALDACQAAAHGFRKLDRVWIVGRSFYRPFAEGSHAQSAFDRELWGHQARLNDGDQSCGSSEAIDFRGRRRNLLRHAKILAAAG